ncbi:hypothetical protein PUN28_011880 [Cardiocondyla obscurior]|uniref:Secreted protein n=1 Tax=Cardiocondyla obscurior TaxID=286306 RepID=A0AAW2FIF8_9HYME
MRRRLLLGSRLLVARRQLTLVLNFHNAKILKKNVCVCVCVCVFLLTCQICCRRSYSPCTLYCIGFRTVRRARTVCRAYSNKPG